MDFVFKQVWIIYAVIIAANALSLKYKSKKYIVQNPELKDGYDFLFKSIMLYGNIPCAIMAIGSLSGLVSKPTAYFHPASLNPMVIVFNVSIIFLWVLLTRWIYFKQGAEFLERHPGLFHNGFNHNTNATATQIKLFYAFALIGGIGGLLLTWYGDLHAAGI